MAYREREIEKIYWRIDEVANMVNVPTSSVRYWETVIDWVRPKYGRKGHRRYTREQRDNVLKVGFLRSCGIGVQAIKKAHDNGTLDNLLRLFNYQG